MSRHVFRAELRTAVGGLVATIDADNIQDLRKTIAKEWVPILEDGDIVQVFETWED